MCPKHDVNNCQWNFLLEVFLGSYTLPCNKDKSLLSSPFITLKDSNMSILHSSDHKLESTETHEK